VASSRRTTFILSGLLLAAIPAFALGERATLVRQANIYLSPDVKSNKLSEVERGRELIILEGAGAWLHVEATLGKANVDPTLDEEDQPDRTLTGWMLDKGIVRASTPNGDRIVYGEAADSEDQASRRHGRRGAAQDALRLYFRVYDLFPTSPLAGDALYRAADIRWQVDKADVNSRPSAHAKEAYLRVGMNEEWMKAIIKKFPGTKWADLAAFQLIDNKLCGDWQGSTKCPEKEADMYEKYAAEHPQSPAAPQALYEAGWRRAALIEMYKSDNDQKKSEESRAKALALAQKVLAQYPQSDYASRAQVLSFKVQQNIPTYGNAID
jgi:outer membrane protein assembly factor BamD (BamD/ComL family)